MPLTRFSVIEPGNTSAPQPREVLVKGEGPSPVSVEKHRLSGGLADGIDVLDVDNGLFSFRVLLSKGMGLWRGRCGDVDLKWDSPRSRTGPSAACSGFSPERTRLARRV